MAIKQGSNGFFDQEFFNTLRLLGNIFGREDEGRSLLNYIQSQRDELVSTVGTISNRANEYVGCIGNWGKTNAYGTSLNFPILNYAGVNNVVDSLASQYESKAQITIDAEKLL